MQTEEKDQSRKTKVSSYRRERTHARSYRREDKRRMTRVWSYRREEEDDESVEHNKMIIKQLLCFFYQFPAAFTTYVYIKCNKPKRLFTIAA